MFGRVQNNHAHGGGGGGGNVCKFYQQGRCKFGDSCKFDHPGANRSQDNQNRFQALGNQGNSFGQGNRNNQRPAGPGRGQQYTSPNQFLVTKDGIEADLKSDRPKWPFSAYGPGKDAPKQLFGGYPLETSPEEMRSHHYQAVANGNVQSAIQTEQELITQTTKQTETILSDLNGAVKYVLDGQNEHPNRLDLCQSSNGNVFQVGRQFNPEFATPTAAPITAAPGQTGGFGQSSTLGGGGFGQQSAVGGGSFGQTSALGQKPSPFGQPASGGPATGGFGQASTLGQKPSPFGQPAGGGFGHATALGTKPNAFGQPPSQSGGFGAPSPLGQGGAFGRPSGGAQASPFAQAAQQNQQQPSPFGQAAQSGGGFGSAPAFGQPSAPGNNQQTGVFGSPSTLGQQQNTAFGQPSGLGQQPKPAFGQPSAPGQQNNAFGQPSAPGQQPSPFGQQNSPFGKPSMPGQQNSSPFGQPPAPAQQNNSPFGQPSAPAQQNNSPFGQPFAPAQQSNTFGQQPAPTQQDNAFGQPPASNAQTNAFGQPSGLGQAQGNQQQQSPFAQAAAKPNPFGQPSQPVNNQAASPFTQAAATQQQPQTNGAAPSNPPPQGEWITRNPNNTIKSFKGSPVQYLPAPEGSTTNEPHYRKPDGSMERIWLVDGTPARKPETEGPEDAYTPELEAAYKFAAEHGVFADGIMPEVPPRFDWIRWDL